MDGIRSPPPPPRAFSCSLWSMSMWWCRRQPKCIGSDSKHAAIFVFSYVVNRSRHLSAPHMYSSCFRKTSVHHSHPYTNTWRSHIHDKWPIQHTNTNQTDNVFVHIQYYIRARLDANHNSQLLGLLKLLLIVEKEMVDFKK